MDARLLALAQRRVPLVPRPYAALAVQLGTHESAVLERLAALRQQKPALIREISAVPEASALGYESALAACQVDAAGLDAAGFEVALHPGVSHCYARDGELNLWYTLTLGSDSQLGLQATAERLAGKISARRSYLLPSLRRYKVEVHIDAAGAMDSQAQNVDPPEYRPLSDVERRTILALQKDLPTQPQPFDALAAGAELSLERLLATGAELLDRRVIRRYGATLNHRSAGLQSNVLAAWRVDEAQADEAGRIAAGNKAVSHCYLRASFEDWPYNLYTMIHGRSREECAAIIEQIAAETGLSDCVRLWTLKEYKKARIRYFSDEVARWERECL